MVDMDIFLVLSGTIAFYLSPLTLVILRTGLAFAVPAPQIFFLKIPCKSLIKPYFLENKVFSLPGGQNGSLTQGRKGRSPEEGE